MTTIIDCPKCGQKLRVHPSSPDSELWVVCTICRHGFGWPERAVSLRGGGDIERFGKPLVRKPDPTRAEFRSLKFRCSRDGRIFSPVVMKEALGERYRLVSNGTDGEYLGLLERHGCAITPLYRGMIDGEEIDLTGLLCGVCGYGRSNGDPFDTFRCLNCENVFCGRSIKQIYNGPTTVFCPICGKVYELQPRDGPISYQSAVFIGERPEAPANIGLLNRMKRRLLS